MNYKGYDYTELEEALSLWIKPPDRDHDELGMESQRYEDAVDALLNDIFNNRNAAEAKQACREIRAYLRILAKVTPAYDAPLWRGLAAIKDDFTLCSYFHSILRGAWS